MKISDLLAASPPEEDVVLPSGVGTVRVRGLTRHEAVAMNRFGKDDEAREAYAIATAMLDPVMAEADVKEWQRFGVAADLQAVAIAVSRLSNLEEGSGKAATKSVSRGNRRGN